MNLESITDTQSWYKICKIKTSQETEKSLRKFLKPPEKPKVIHTDKTLECGRSCGELTWNHSTSTPHRSETNGVAERAVRRTKEGTCAVLLQPVLDERWWAYSMECCCNLRNIQDLLSGGKTPYERRFGIPVHGPVNPFGALVEYHHVSGKELSRLHQFGPKVLPGLSLGYALIAEICGKEIFWSQTVKNWKRWTHRKLSLRNKRHKNEKCSYSELQMVQQN